MSKKTLFALLHGQKAHREQALEQLKAHPYHSLLTSHGWQMEDDPDQIKHINDVGPHGVPYHHSGHDGSIHVDDNYWEHFDSNDINDTIADGRNMLSLYHYLKYLKHQRDD